MFKLLKTIIALRLAPIDPGTHVRGQRQPPRGSRTWSRHCDSLGALIGLVLVPRVLLLMRHVCEVIGHGGAGHSDLRISVIIKEQCWG